MSILIRDSMGAMSPLRPFLMTPAQALWVVAKEPKLVLRAAGVPIL